MVCGWFVVGLWLRLTQMCIFPQRQGVAAAVATDTSVVTERQILHIPRHRTPEIMSPERFAKLDPVDRVKAVYDTHGDKAVQLSSMQKTAGVIMHLIHRAKVPIPILFFDTQYIHQVSPH